MKIKNLTHEAVKEYIVQIAQGLEASIDNFSDEGHDRELLKWLVGMLDDGDLDDFWGTEGWKHQFGIED